MQFSNADYKKWLILLKGKIRSVQIKAAFAVNTALIHFYWELGKTIAEKETVWGSKFLENLSKDLQDEFPEMKGFSVSNLKTYKLFFQYFSSQAVNEIKKRTSLKSSQPANELQNTLSSQPRDKANEEQKIPNSQLVFQIP